MKIFEIIQKKSSGPDPVTRLPGRPLAWLIAVLATVLLLGSCYAPITTDEQGISLDVSMGSRGLPTGDTVVLAGLLINSGFEDTLKEVTQLMVAIDSGSGTAPPEVQEQMENQLEEILLDVALGGTMKFSGNPYFAIEVDYDDTNNEADFVVTGVPADRDYFLYMGGFDTIEDVKKFFGLMDEEEGDEYNEDTVNYSHIFYLEGDEEAGTVNVPFEVEGINYTNDFVITTHGLYEGPGWYYVNPWDFTGGIKTTLKTPAGQPFTVRSGETTTVEVYLTNDIN
jgi:hypothetical protein